MHTIVLLTGTTVTSEARPFFKTHASRSNNNSCLLEAGTTAGSINQHTMRTMYMVCTAVDLSDGRCPTFYIINNKIQQPKMIVVVENLPLLCNMSFTEHRTYLHSYHLQSVDAIKT